MDCFSPVHLIILLHTALALLAPLPAPLNVSMNSVNFRHILRWDPGPGTPPGTEYRIYASVVGRRQSKLKQTTTNTSCQLTLSNRKEFSLKVRAVFNGSMSPESHKVHFCPFTDTEIGPPRLSLTGWNNSIHVNITLPEADRHSKIKDIEEFGCDFRVLWKKTGDKRAAVNSSPTNDKHFTLRNLDSGVEYCVQVEINCNVNKNTKSSDWICATTRRHEELRIGPVVIGAVSVPVIVVVISMFCLHYSGFLCKVKAVLPRDLIMVLSHGYVLTPERTFPDQLSICSETGKNRKRNPTTLSAIRGSNSEEEDDEEEEEDEGHVYLDRIGEVSSDEMSRQGSGNTSGNSETALSRSDGSFTEKFSAKLETLYTESHQDKVKAEKVEVSFTHKGDETGIQRQVADDEEEEEEMEEEMETITMNISGNVNLFSVILGALATSEEEEEESEQNTEDFPPDLLTLSCQGHEVDPDSSLDLSHTDSETELYNNQTEGLIEPTHKDYYGLR